MLNISTELPQHGYSRASQLLSCLPFGSTTLWVWLTGGKCPKPIKISNAVVIAWSNKELHTWFARQQASNDDTYQTEEV